MAGTTVCFSFVFLLGRIIKAGEVFVFFFETGTVYVCTGVGTFGVN